jgi:hypothetical protein
VFSINFASDERFYVRADGYLHSTYGNIAGWDITSNSIVTKDYGLGIAGSFHIYSSGTTS